MHFIALVIILHLTLVKNSLAAQCYINNPCELGGYFVPPKYDCYQLASSPNDAICTCPNGEARQNSRCRICDSINCGPFGTCFERAIFPNSFYFCGCNNGTGSYAIPGPCPSASSSTTTTTTTTTSTTTMVTTPLPIHCLNGGTYLPATHSCACRTGYGGPRCEVAVGQEICRYITCDNGGVCNPVPTMNNQIDIECWCLNGFSGTNCELLGTPGGCTSQLCRNGGRCVEKTLGSSRFAYCQCSPGYAGQFCENHYFTCPHWGLFTDTVNCKYGRYFQCVDKVPVVESCQKGYRFNSNTMQCTWNAPCP